ncbi:helix-turn-helix transcriptional regulator [Streptomyces sp. VRA16 Mangrove soil]|uniref:helix-turn-helix domain-containing protein n=1 Tax=Streptomyces sp. VRA16 Mangrove soil TaxID=2817434 RepID=UPI001A9E84D1|nr:helix-turn-helix transcriptional regulator [Streptomyces sp. VRA16 Mangrove soil]MBO1336290.1 helix-turn-helix domain-containing protein [Streptomyces sp. VRA16 Mangrove soil]
MKKQVTSWHAIGAQIANYRKRAGMTQTELADRLCVSYDKMASIEQGRRPVDYALAEQIDELFGTQGALAVAVAKIPAREKYPAILADLVEYEEKALTILSYQTQVVPGLLQTPEYMRAVFDASYPPLTHETAEDWITARIGRQLIWEREHPPASHFIIEEAVLHKPVGGPEVMRGQYRRILELGQLHCMGVQIMPTRQWPHAGLAGPMVLLEDPEHDFVAFIEGHRVSNVLDDPKDISNLHLKYGMLQSQALSPDESARLLDGLLGAS